MKTKLLMNAIICGFITFFSFVGTVQAGECPVIQSHQQYEMFQAVVAWGSDLEIWNGNQKVGRIYEKVFAWTKSIELYNENDQLVSKARMRINPFRTTVDVYDCEDHMVGSFQEDVLKSLLRTLTVYSILDGNGNLLGQSQKIDFFFTNLNFYDSTGKTNANLFRQYRAILPDKWVVSVSENSVIDRRILFFAAAYKTSADKQQNKE